MVYLNATLVCMLAPFIYLGSLASRDREIIATENSWIVGPGLFCGSLFGLAFLMGLFPSPSWKSNDSINIVPLLVLVGGMISLLVNIYLSIHLLRRPADGVLTKAAEGICIIAVAASAYMIYAAVDDLIFWRDKSANGIMSNTIFEKSDVKCDSTYIIVRREGNAFRFRCPHNLVLGHPFGEPFIPWPSYDEGVSEKLLAAEEAFVLEVRKQEQEQKANPAQAGSSQ